MPAGAPGMIKLEPRQYIVGASALALVTVFLGALYFYAVATLDRQAVARLDSLALHSAALINDWLLEHTTALELITALTADDKTDITCRISAGLAELNRHSSTGALAVLALDGQDMTVLSAEACRPLPQQGEAKRRWEAAFSRAGGRFSEQTYMEGPTFALTGGNPMIAFFHPLAHAADRNSGSLALCVPLEALNRRLQMVQPLHVGGRQYFLCNKEGELMLPPPSAGATTTPEAFPALRSLVSMNGNDAFSLLYLGGQKHIIAAAEVGATGWTIFLLSPSTYERLLHPTLFNTFAGAWLIMCAFIMFLLYQAYQQGYYKILSEQDHLTGAGNRLAFTKAVEKVQIDSNYPVSLIIMDIDSLKLYNDTLGHEQGDTLLRRVALLLQRSLRENDALFRLGGDEFAIIVDNSTLATAGLLADRINDQAARARQNASLPPPYFSLGLADAHTEEELATLYARADAAMYANKKMCRAATCEAIKAWLHEHPEALERRGRATSG